MKRREFITLLGGAATTWPLAARAQQSVLPTVGFLGTGSPETDSFRVVALRKGLSETGHVEGQNVAIEFRWAHGQYDRLPGLAADLVARPVSVIVAGPLPATVAAKGATSTIPIVFANGNDPVKYGLVAGLNRPGGNVTGVSFLVNVLMAKQLELLHETVPKAAMIGFLMNPNNPNGALDMREVHTAADTLGRKLLDLKASTAGEIETAFTTLAQQQVSALLIHADAFFTSRHEALASRAARDKLASIFYLREFAVAGGLMSYGASITDGYQQAGIYAGRILKGEKPADLPVQQPVKVELVLNLKTARALGLTFPITLLGRADEVVE